MVLVPVLHGQIKRAPAQISWNFLDFEKFAKLKCREKYCNSIQFFCEGLFFFFSLIFNKSKIIY